MVRSLLFRCIGVTLALMAVALLSVPIDVTSAAIQAAPFAFAAFVAVGVAATAAKLFFGGLTRHQVLALVFSRERVRHDAFREEMLRAA